MRESCGRWGGSKVRFRVESREGCARMCARSMDEYSGLVEGHRIR